MTSNVILIKNLSDLCLIRINKDVFIKKEQHLIGKIKNGRESNMFNFYNKIIINIESSNQRINLRATHTQR